MNRNNHSKLFSILFLACILTVLCSGCVSSQPGSSTQTETDPVVGTWEVETLTVGSSELKADEYLKSIGMKDRPVLVFEKNGRVRFTGLGKKVDPNGEWKASGQAYLLDDGEEELSCKMTEDGKLELTFPKERSDALSGDLIITFQRKKDDE